MAIKIIFVGNPLGGDDGIGPYLYDQLKDDSKLKDFKMLELGVIGLDMISYIEDNDKLIIVDAVRSEKNIGDVILLGENDLSKDLNLVSQHDFGVEQTATILRLHMPKLKKINIIGIKVSNIKSFTDKLSNDIMTKIPEIKEKVIKHIIQISK